MPVSFWPTLFIGIFLGCILCLTLYGVMLAVHNRRKRREALEQFEHIDADERCLSRISYPPSYGVRIKI